MSPPINIGGDTVEAATIGGTDVSEVTVDGSRVFSAIPDSVVLRPDDNLVGGSDTAERGMEINLKTEWPSIGARISNQTSGVTRAYLRDSGFNLIFDVDVSGLTAGDAFSFDGVGLSTGTYYITLDAEGASYDYGYNGDAESFPYTTTDVDLTARVIGTNTDQFASHMVNDVGNVGFS